MPGVVPAFAGTTPDGRVSLRDLDALRPGEARKRLLRHLDLGPGHGQADHLVGVIGVDCELDEPIHALIGRVDDVVVVVFRLHGRSDDDVMCHALIVAGSQHLAYVLVVLEHLGGIVRHGLHGAVKHLIEVGFLFGVQLILSLARRDAAHATHLVKQAKEGITSISKLHSSVSYSIIRLW